MPTFEETPVERCCRWRRVIAILVAVEER